MPWNRPVETVEIVAQAASSVVRAPRLLDKYRLYLEFASKRLCFRVAYVY